MLEIKSWFVLVLCQQGAEEADAVAFWWCDVLFSVVLMMVGAFFEVRRGWFTQKSKGRGEERIGKEKWGNTNKQLL
jgi:hypothetical protein